MVMIYMQGTSSRWACLNLDHALVHPSLRL